MICARHDWWDSAPCPRCEEVVTVAETSELDIPDFLKRNLDGTFVQPREVVFNPHPAAQQAVVPAALPIHHWSDAELFLALESTELSLVDRQPIYQELRAREDKKKSLARIAEMKAKKAANAEGK